MPPRGGRGGGGGGRHGGGHHGHHHHGGHGGYAAPWAWGWGGGWDAPSTQLVVVDRPAAGPLYGSCPCPCRCHDDSKLTHHTVPVAPGQACCRCPFMPRAQAVKAQLSGFELGSVPWKPILAAAGGVAILWWLTRRRRGRR